MSTHNIGFYEEISKIFTYHQICTLFLLLVSVLSILCKYVDLCVNCIGFGYGSIGATFQEIAAPSAKRMFSLYRLFVV